MNPNITQAKLIIPPGAILVIILLVQLTGLAQELPALQQGEPYKKERQKLFAAGWQKVVDLTRSCSDLAGFEKDTCFQYQELGACSASGYCTFLWRNADGKSVRITTYGYGYPLLNWSLE